MLWYYRNMKILSAYIQVLKNKIFILIKIGQQLPLSHLLSIFLYKIMKAFGIVKLYEVFSGEKTSFSKINFDISNILISEKNSKKIIEDAEKIISGKIYLFGIVEEELTFPDQHKALHWSHFKGDQFQDRDIKYFWEPARFSWGIRLAQAYSLTKNDQYAEYLWQKIEDFFQKNPPYKGIQYLSAQEVGMRIITLSYCISILEDSLSSTKERMDLFVAFIEAHAIRIPSTLSYAKAQNNNHLISEAVGLYTAGVVLKDHSKSKKWRKIGLHNFEYAIRKQISSAGTYSQHSVRYHRLMLELVNWMFIICSMNNDKFSEESKFLIRKSIDWLSYLCNPSNGYCPNLGPNDGAYLLPFSTENHNDYRPTLQLSSALFFNKYLYSNNSSFDDFQWLGIEKQDMVSENKFYKDSNAQLIHSQNSYGYFRVEKFRGRPGHADQFHFDLWYKNQNVLLDAGTYAYNKNSPWNNPLSQTFFHNTLYINHSNQMLRGGKFLWLDWANAKKTKKYKDKSEKIRSISAEHDGYAKDNVIHQRIVDVINDEWLIKDTLYKKIEKKDDQVKVGYHLLIKNPISYEINQNRIIFTYESFRMILLIVGFNFEKLIFIKGGKQIFGIENKKDCECFGWVSPTYGYKEEAISLLIEDHVRIPTEFLTKIRFE